MACRNIRPSVFIVAVSCLASLVLSAAQAGEALPPTAAGKLVADWMQLCNSPNLDQMTDWMDTHLSKEGAKRRTPPARAETAFELCSLNGGFRVQDVKEIKPNITLTAMGLKTSLWYQLQFITNDAGELDREGQDPTLPPQGALAHKTSDADIGAELTALTHRLSDADLFSGVVIMARGTTPIATASVGFADHAARTAITGDTQFTIGSIGKLFTAVAIAQLVDQKKLSFDDTVGHFFPKYPNAPVRDAVTVGMLLSHTAGLGDFLDKRPAAMMQKGSVRAAEYLPLFQTDALLFAPGSGWSYSNAGVALAGAIVEKVSGENYADYIHRHIFSAAGMTNSEPNNIPQAHARLVTPYTKESESGKLPQWTAAQADIGSPAGGAISTANDLLRFADALRRGKLISRDTLQILCTANPRSSPDYPYGYAMEIQHIYGQSLFGHSGGFPGVSAELHFSLDTPYSVVVLANQDPPSAAYVSLTAEALMAEKIDTSRKH